MSVIELQNISHVYDDFLALKDINLSIKKNSVTALIGPNGAGKTTLLKCICGQIMPTTGSQHILGMDIRNNQRKIRQKVSFLQDTFGLYDEKVIDVLNHKGLIHKLSKKEIKQKIEEFTDSLNLKDLFQKNVSILSKGQRQRVAVGHALMQNPEILLLDEPAAGLDPLARYDLSNLIKALSEKITLIVSSHILTELEEYATHLCIIEKGQLRLFEEKSFPKWNFKTTKEHAQKFKDVATLTGEDSFAITVSDEKAYEMLKEFVTNNIPISEFRKTQGFLGKYEILIKRSGENNA